MNKLIVFLFLGCCLVVADCANPFRCFRPKKEQPSEKAPVGTPAPKRVDLQGLNEYLVASVPNADTEANLAHLRAANLDEAHLSDEGVRKAVQLVLRLATEGVQCNNQLMLDLSELDMAQLDLDGQKRIEKVISGHWRAALQACNQYVEASYKDADKSLASFMSIFSIGELSVRASVYSTQLNGRRIQDYLDRLITNPEDQYKQRVVDKVEGSSKMVRDDAKLQKAFDKYLVGPCNKILDNSQLLDNMLALRLSWDPVIHENYLQHERDFEVGFDLSTLAWKRGACKRLLNMDAADMAAVALGKHY